LESDTTAVGAAVVSDWTDAAERYWHALEKHADGDESGPAAAAACTEAVGRIARRRLDQEEQSLLAEVLKAHRYPSPYSEDFRLLVRAVSEHHPYEEELRGPAYRDLLEELHDEMVDCLKQQ
jgi:hypothetical protein